MFMHFRFDPARDSLALESQLRRLITRRTVYNAVMRIRTSYGVFSWSDLVKPALNVL